MAQIDGDNAVLDDPFPYTLYNAFKNHWRDTAAPTNAQPGMIWSDSDDERLYHITAAGSNQIAQGAIMPVATGIRLTQPGGADYLDLLLDGTDAFIKWSDGTLVLMTDEGTNTVTKVDIKGKGTGWGTIRIFDEDDAEYLTLVSSTGAGFIETGGSSPSYLSLMENISQIIKCWAGITAGNPYFYIYGYKTAVGVKYLRQSVNAAGNALIEAEGEMIFTPVGNFYIGDTANTKMTQGLTINQGANDDEILALKSSDVAHGMTDLVETDTYGLFRKATADGGGLMATGIGEGSLGIMMRGYATSCDTTKTVAATAAHTVIAYKKSNSSVGNVDADANVWCAKAMRGGSEEAVVIIDEDGDIYYDGAAPANYDEYNDPVACHDVARHLYNMKRPIKEQLTDFIEYNREDLVAMGVISDGNFVSTKNMTALILGAISQLYKENQMLQNKIKVLEN